MSIGKVYSFELIIIVIKIYGIKFENNSVGQSQMKCLMIIKVYSPNFKTFLKKFEPLGCSI